tara:strand:+ start:864 stop:2096 length:1233 start_codon:yes stop_codon:yes gene_type:complete
MLNKDSWKEIFETIQKNKLRTFLSGFTVAIGILIFIVLFGLGNGLKNSFNSSFIDDKVNTIRLYPSTTTIAYKGYEKNRKIKLTNKDLSKIYNHFYNDLEDITVRVTDYTEIKYKNNANSYSIRGVSPSHQNAELTIIMKGRFLNENDIINKKKHIVIGRLVAEKIFGKEDPIGKYIFGGNHGWKVIGVFQDEGGDREESMIYVPYTTLQKLKKNTDELNQIILMYKSDMSYSESVILEKKLEKFIKEYKFISPKDNRGIYISNTSEELQENKQFASILNIIVSFIGIGTLIAGIIGISNIMVFVVKERTKELGIRKALGATPKNIISIILQESIFITTLSGYFGLVIAFAILKIIGNKLQEDYWITNPSIETENAILATVLLIFFGTIAGYIPAKKAANIKPIIALRDN